MIPGKREAELLVCLLLDDVLPDCCACMRAQSKHQETWGGVSWSDIAVFALLEGATRSHAFLVERRASRLPGVSARALPGAGACHRPGCSTRTSPGKPLVMTTMQHDM